MGDDVLDEQARSFNAAFTAVATALVVDAQPSEGLDVTDAQLLLLYTLDSTGELRTGRLAAEVGLLGPSVSRMVRGLLARGLVDRTVDPTDGRANLVRLTAAGRKLVATHRGRLVASSARVLARLDDATRADVLRSMEFVRTTFAR